MINYGRDLSAAQPSVPQVTGSATEAEVRSDVLVHRLWEQGSGCVLDTCATDTDAKAYQNQSSKKVLERVT